VIHLSKKPALSSDGSRGKTVASAVFRWIIVAVGIVAWCVVGMNGLAWHHQNSPLRYVARLALLLVVVAALASFIITWHRRHAVSVREEQLSGTSVFDELAELSLDELTVEIEKIAFAYRDLTLDSAKMIANHLLQPERFRSKVTESVDLKAQQTVHEIEIAWRPGGAYLTSPNTYVVPVMRPHKKELPREVSIQGGNVLGSFETIALLYSVAIRLSNARWEDPTISRTRELARRELVRAIVYQPGGTDSRPNADLVHDFFASTQQQSALLDPTLPGTERQEEIRPDLLFSELVDTLISRRPYFAVFRPDDPTETKPTLMSYRADLLDYPVQSYDFWRRFKDRARMHLGLPQRVFYVPLERARSADSYSLHVSCMDDLYIDEANVWAPSAKGGDWVRPLPRRGNYRAYLGWERPTGKAFLGLAAVKLWKTRRLKDLLLVVRIREKPPGSLAQAGSISLGTLIAIWLVGTTGLHIKEGIDLVAFVLALPAVAASTFGFNAGTPPHGLRSVTGIVSTVTSFTLSLFSIAVFLAQHETSNPLGSPTLGHGKQFFFLTDKIWIGLFVLASANLVITLGTLIMRLMRYGDLTRNRTRAW
jgi:hypothetical protein